MKTATNQNYKHAIVCIGDSLTHNMSLGVNLFSAWPRKLQDYLQAEGRKVICRNAGQSGNTTTQMLARITDTTIYGTPDIGVIFGGVNDPGNAITQATTQSNIQSMITHLKNSGCNNIIVMSAQFLNFTSAGDYDANNVPYTDAQCYYASVIAAQKAAASASGAVYCDLYNYLRNRIINGQETLKSASWHVAGTNQHFSAYGWDLVAQCILATIKAQGWDSILR